MIFLADSFTTFTEPGVGRASIELLEAAGYDVRLESGGCCGRASISKGLLDDARAKATALHERLGGDAIITGCEPSCVLTLREEHVQLLGDDGVAGRVKLVEELLLEAIDAAAALKDLGPRRILFHGHCHQKALAGTAATVALLQAPPGRRGRRARRRLLRHGRIVRLRGRALRAVHAHRRDAPVPGRAPGTPGDADRRHRRLLPPADRARHRARRRAIRCRSSETHST